MLFVLISISFYLDSTLNTRSKSSKLFLCVIFLFLSINYVEDELVSDDLDDFIFIGAFIFGFFF